MYRRGYDRTVAAEPSSDECDTEVDGGKANDGVEDGIEQELSRHGRKELKNYSARCGRGNQRNLIPHHRGGLIAVGCVVHIYVGSGALFVRVPSATESILLTK
jgi:hypothetical protein